MIALLIEKEEIMMRTRLIVSGLLLAIFLPPATVATERASVRSEFLSGSQLINLCALLAPSYTKSSCYIAPNPTQCDGCDFEMCVGLEMCSNLYPSCRKGFITACTFYCVFNPEFCPSSCLTFSLTCAEVNAACVSSALEDHEQCFFDKSC